MVASLEIHQSWFLVKLSSGSFLVVHLLSAGVVRELADLNEESGQKLLHRGVKDSGVAVNHSLQ